MGNFGTKMPKPDICEKHMGYMNEDDGLISDLRCPDCDALIVCPNCFVSIYKRHLNKAELKAVNQCTWRGHDPFKFLARRLLEAA